jgi:hypothetical protein
MKRYAIGISTLALAFFLAVQFFAPQVTMADEQREKNKDQNYTEFRGPKRFTQLTGATLRNFEGEELGRIDDVVFKDGNVQYVIVSVGGVMGFADRLIPVPWRAIRTSDAEDAGNQFYVDMKADRFVRSPSFARDNWPSFTDRNLDNTVFGYFQVERKDD